MEQGISFEGRRAPGAGICAVTGTRGRAVDLVTLKCQLRPEALATLDPEARYFFCAEPQCDVTYFSERTAYGRTDLKRPVFQKDTRPDVPVCYCFGWTRRRIACAMRQGDAESPVTAISAHIQAGRCGCEFNNPQGSCCLGNVRSVVKSIENEHR